MADQADQMADQGVISPENTSEHYLVDPGSALTGEITVPGDKSISHRAVMLGAIAQGDTEIDGLLDADDCFVTIEALRDMGVEIQNVDEDYWVVRGRGMTGLHAPSAPIDCRHSATSMRLFLGLLTGQPFDSTITGNEALLERSMSHLIEPLIEMGASITTQENGTGPFTISGGHQLEGKKLHLPLASHQAKLMPNAATKSIMIVEINLMFLILLKPSFSPSREDTKQSKQ